MQLGGIRKVSRPRCLSGGGEGMCPSFLLAELSANEKRPLDPPSGSYSWPAAYPSSWVFLPDSGSSSASAISSRHNSFLVGEKMVDPQGEN